LEYNIADDGGELAIEEAVKNTASLNQAGGKNGITINDDDIVIGIWN